MMKLVGLLVASAALTLAQHPVDAYNMVWNSPGKDASGSMPLGNGDIGLNLWTEENGDIVFYLAKSDAWSENGQLMKLGRVRLRFTPSPFGASQRFRQTLSLRTGEILLQGGASGAEAKITVWVDALNPVVRVEAELDKPADLQVIYER